MPFFVLLGHVDNAQMDVNKPLVGGNIKEAFHCDELLMKLATSANAAANLSKSSRWMKTRWRSLRTGFFSVGTSVMVM